MSRIGKKEIVLPAGVELTVSPENVVTVKGPKGTLTQEVDKAITINKNENVVNLTRDSDIGTIRAKHGLYRALIANMVEVVINGVGYKAQVQGNKLVMNLGLSHPVEVEAEEGVAFECPTATEIKVSGIDKQLVGQVAAKIRSLRKVEPYHEYGIKYKGERVVRKVGKAAGKGKK